MLKRVLLGTALAALTTELAFAQSSPLPGRQLDTIAAAVTSIPVPSQGGEVFDVRPLVGIFWDERCASVEYTFNTNQGANEGTPGRIGPNILANNVQRGLNRWNNIRTAYIEMNVTNRTDLGNRPRIGGDFINEVTFITPGGFTALASSPSTSLIADTDFVAGDDLDLDGDSDVYDPVAEGLNVCTDIDNDGDIEFPAGFYRAGTILDNDVQFGADVTWETGTPTGGGGVADVDAVSTHEFGHSHGLNHSFVNLISAADGSGATMFPFIDTNDPFAEFANRSLHIDDIAATSQIYPEGQGTEPITQLQGNDQAFDSRFSIVSGSVEDGLGNPIAGAAISALRTSDGGVSSLTYSGRTGAFQNATGLFAFPESVQSGAFELAVPSNFSYQFEVQALDGDPAAAGNISTNAIIGQILGQNFFPQERFDADESAVELDATAGETIAVGLTDESGVDFVLNENITLRNSAPAGLGLSANIFGAASIRYIEHFPREDVELLLDNSFIPVAGGVHTSQFGEGTQTYEFSRGALAIGNFMQDGTPRIRELIGTVENVLAEDDDITVVPFTTPADLGDQIRAAYDAFPTAEIFFVLDIDSVQTGNNVGFPLAFQFVDFNTAGTSFLAANGADPVPITDLTWAMELSFIPALADPAE